ncbi:MAG: hypothetical protein V1701_07415 [Planctomycetota bacterium]
MKQFLKRFYDIKRFLLLGICVSVLAGGVSFIYFFMPFAPMERSILISRITTLNNMEMRLTQTHNTHILEPYTISFYYKDYNDKSWKWFYIDHEDFYWWSGCIKLNEDIKRATIFRGSKALAYFDWEQETLTFIESGHTVKGPQAIISDTAELDRRGLQDVPTINIGEKGNK